jgi:hypothetical protein
LYFDTNINQLYLYDASWLLANTTTVASAAPTTPPPQVGQLYWNSTSGQLNVYTGSAWKLAFDPIDAGTF